MKTLKLNFWNDKGLLRILICFQRNDGHSCTLFSTCSASQISFTTRFIRHVALTMEAAALCQPLCFKFVSSWYQADLTVNQAIIKCPTQLRWREVNSLTLSLLLKAQDSVSPKLIARDALTTTCATLVRNNPIGSLLHETVFLCVECWLSVWGLWSERY